MSDANEEKKIIIDEDWKSQVQAERESAAQSKSTEENVEPPQPEAGQMPPASFATLITMFATEAMVGLGQIPHPATNEAAVHLDQAKYFIDTLAVLQEKTKGNLTSEEDQALEGMLHELRMAFVMAKVGAK